MTDTTDIPQLDTVDAAIDALADAPLLEVYRTLLPFDDQMVTATAVKRALAGGGGASTVKAVDLGVITAADVFADGPQTLYSRASGEVLSWVRWLDTDFETIDVFPGQFSLGIGTTKSFGWYSYAPWRGQASPSDLFGLFRDQGLYGPDLAPALGSSAMVLSGIGDVVAAWFLPLNTDNGHFGVIVDAVTAWAAHTDYALAAQTPVQTLGPQKCAIVANGTVWINTGGAGTSGASEPDFAGNADGTVDDGADIVWTDTQDAPPTTGTAHPVAEVLTPA